MLLAFCRMNHTSPDLSAPIGVFDSGVGGLSVLRQLLRLLPHENIVYLADTAYAPYGERSSTQIEARSVQVARYLIERQGIKALVVACNTATAQAVQRLRAEFPHIPLIGIEPALKPAVALTRTGHVGIMATHGTVQSAKFRQLVHDWSGHCHVHVQACNGLALAIENALDDAPETGRAAVRALCQQYVQALQAQVRRQSLSPVLAQTPAMPANSGPEGGVGGMDVLVLGCTHYPFAGDILQDLLGNAVQLIEPGEPVARQTLCLLQQHGLQRCISAGDAVAQLTLLATARPSRLQQAAHNWLGLTNTATAVDID